MQTHSGRPYNSQMYLQSAPAPHPAPSLSHLASELRRDQWTGNFNRMNPIETPSEMIDYESDAVVSYVADQNGPRHEIDETEDHGKQYQQQQHGCCNSTKGNGDRHACEIKLKSTSSVDCSRRPIRCPRLDCLVNVAFSALTHHFLFDHPEVPILCVEPGAKRTLIISYGALACNSSRCLALLLVSGKLSLVYIQSKRSAI